MVIFYLLFTLLAGALAGCLAHLIRAVFNLYPDKISSTRWVNILVSSDYSIEDDLLGVEFDEYSGYYKLFSARNLKISVVIWTGMAFVFFALYPDYQALCEFIDSLFVGVAELAVSRWNTLRLY